MNIKKSILVSVAALGMFAAAASVNANQASAKTYAKVTSNQKLGGDANSRNVTFTGKNALYTKAGTLKGARRVASTSTLRSFANSNSSKQNFRAYRVATTNRGSVYYKVVAFDQTVRGWIYGGKSTASFNGGVDQFDTFKTGQVNDTMKGLYKIANVGTANDDKTVTYKAPSWTQYKIGRQITDSTPYKDTTFRIDQIGTRTREGDQWVHITNTDATNTNANGWILYSGLTQAQEPIADNVVKINFVNSAGNLIKSANYTVAGAAKGTTLGQLIGNAGGNVWNLPPQRITDIQNIASINLAGTGYTLANGVLTNDQKTTLAQTKTGSEVNITVQKISTNQAFPDMTFNTKADQGLDYTGVTSPGDDLSAAHAVVSSSKYSGLTFNDLKGRTLSLITGDYGTTVSPSTIINALTQTGLNDFYVVYKPSLGGSSALVNTSANINLDSQDQIWHYTSPQLSGNPTAGQSNMNVNYNIQKKQVKGTHTNVTPSQWASIFNSIN